MANPQIDSRLATVLDTERLLLLRSLDGDKGAFLDELIDMYLDATPAVIERILTAITAERIEETVLLAHKFKGMASNIGISRLVAMLERIEVSFADMSLAERASLPTDLRLEYELSILQLRKDWHHTAVIQKAV